jgi:hypothetical protein
MAGAAAPNGCGGAGKLAALAVGAAGSAAAQAWPAAVQLKTGKDATDRIIRDHLVRYPKAELRIGWFF